MAYKTDACHRTITCIRFLWYMGIVPNSVHCICVQKPKEFPRPVQRYTLENHSTADYATARNHTLG